MLDLSSIRYTVGSKSASHLYWHCTSVAHNAESARGYEVPLELRRRRPFVRLSTGTGSFNDLWCIRLLSLLLLLPLFLLYLCLVSLSLSLNLPLSFWLLLPCSYIKETLSKGVREAEYRYRLILRPQMSLLSCCLCYCCFQYFFPSLSLSCLSFSIFFFLSLGSYHDLILSLFSFTVAFFLLSLSLSLVALAFFLLSLSFSLCLLIKDKSKCWWLKK